MASVPRAPTRPTAAVRPVPDHPGRARAPGGGNAGGAGRLLRPERRDLPECRRLRPADAPAAVRAAPEAAPASARGLAPAPGEPVRGRPAAAGLADDALPLRHLRARRVRRGPHGA